MTVVDRFTTSSQALVTTPSSNTVATSTPSHQQQSSSSVPASLPSPAAQPYYVKLLNGHIKVCAGCRLGNANRNPPFDICIVHQETRPITHPVTKEKMNMPVNAHYHVTKECIQRNDPKFIPSQAVVPERFKEKLNNPIYQTLFTQKLGPRLFLDIVQTFCLDTPPKEN